jgi:diguanylate cyclase (GGDEF)-like protein
MAVALLGYVNISSMKSSLDAKAFESAAEKANESANVITQLFDMRLNALRSSARFLSEDTGRDAFKEKYPLLEYSLSLSGFESYALKWYDKWYNVTHSEYSEKQPLSEFHGLSGYVMFGSLYRDDSQGLLLTQPIYNRNEYEIGRIVAKLPANVLWKDINSTDSLVNANVIISKQTGEILYPSEYSGGLLTTEDKGKISPLKISYENKTVNTSGMTLALPDSALNVTVCVNYDSVIQGYNETVFLIVIVALLGMLVIGSIVYFAASRMTRSITELAECVAQMGTDFETIPDRFTQRRDEAGTLANSFALLLMRLKSALDEKDYLARHDSLTHLKNRYCLERNIVNLINNQRPFAFGLLDLDDFKVINDTMGHDEGDKLLKNLASVFSSFKPEELIAYRWGGDEFALVIFGDSSEQYEKILTDVMQRVKDRFSGDGPHVTVSIGVSIYPESASTYKNLLITADKALAWAKMTGKVNFCFYRK